MSTASRRADFFVLEAAEYVNDLNQLVSQREPPDAERLVRGARALRGAALMAGLGTFARASASLESIARGVRDHELAWDPHARRGWQEGLAALRGLVGRATIWAADDDRQALALSERLERIAGGQATPEILPPQAAALTPGVRAFIARESVLIAGSLEEAARALAPVPPPAALAAVLERMRALRGLGASTDLTPLPELLDAMEVATRTLLDDHPAPLDAASVFTDAAHALGEMARGIAASGRVTAPAALDSVARRLLSSYTSEADVVLIASLAPDGADSVIHRGALPPQADTDPLPVELVSVGDHLVLAADSLARTEGSAARDLRLFVLHRTLSTMPSRSGTARFLLPMTNAIRLAVAAGVPSSQPDAFLKLVRDCGQFLVNAGSEQDQAVLRADRDRILSGVSGAAALSAVPTAAPNDHIVPIEQLAFDDIDAVIDIATLGYDADVVDIATLAPDDDVVPIESLAPDAAPASPDGIPSYAEGEPSRLEVAFRKRRALTRAETVASSVSTADTVEMPVVDIVTLLYRGPRALDRMAELHAELSPMVREGTSTTLSLLPLIKELADLIPLARDDG
ncbi:MAG: Hpt domain-containing protein [Gemmatimonadales bacterium]